MGGRGASYWKKNGIDRQREDYSGGMPFDPKEFEDPESAMHTKAFKALKESGISTRKSTDDLLQEIIEPQQKHAKQIADEYSNILSEVTTATDMQLAARYIRGNVAGYTASLPTENGVQVRVVLDKHELTNPNQKAACQNQINHKWHPPINVEKNYKVETLTHEMGHAVEHGLFERMRRKDPKTCASMTNKELATKVRNDVGEMLQKDFPNSNLDDILYISDYGLKNSMEWFAETFTNLRLSDKPQASAQALENYIRSWE